MSAFCSSERNDPDQLPRPVGCGFVYERPAGIALAGVGVVSAGADVVLGDDAVGEDLSARVEIDDRNFNFLNNGCCSSNRLKEKTKYLMEKYNSETLF